MTVDFMKGSLPLFIFIAIWANLTSCSRPSSLIDESVPDLSKPSKQADFTVMRKDNLVQLQGSASSETEAILIRELSALEEIKIDNQLVGGEDVALGHSQVALAIAKFMSEVDVGKVHAAPSKIIVKGSAKSGEARDGLLAMFHPDRWSWTEIVTDIGVAVAAASPPIIEEKPEINPVETEVKPEPIPARPVRSKPTHFIVLKNGDQVTLAGRVAGRGSRSILEQAVQRPGLKITNEIEVREDVMILKPFNSYVEGIRDLLTASKKDAEFELSPNGILLKGEVADMEIKKAILVQFADSNGVVDQILVLSKPSKFNIVKSGNKVALQGSVDSADTKNTLGKLVSLNGIEVDNKIVVGENNKSLNVKKPLEIGIPALLSATSNANIEISEKRLLLDGQVEDIETRDKIISIFAAEGGWSKDQIIDQLKIAKLKPAVVVPDLDLPLLVNDPNDLDNGLLPLFAKLRDIEDNSKAREKAYREIRNGGDAKKLMVVSFKSGSFEVNDTDRAALRELVTNDPDSKFLVVGYASVEGAADANAKLSSNRASQVGQAMVGGVETSKTIQAVYFGQTNRFLRWEGDNASNRIVEVWRLPR